MEIHEAMQEVVHNDLHRACLEAFTVYFEATQIRDWDTAATVLHDRFTLDLRNAGLN